MYTDASNIEVVGHDPIRVRTRSRSLAQAEEPALPALCGRPLGNWPRQCKIYLYSTMAGTRTAATAATDGAGWPPSRRTVHRAAARLGRRGGCGIAILADRPSGRTGRPPQTRRAL